MLVHQDQAIREQIEVSFGDHAVGEVTHDWFSQAPVEDPNARMEGWPTAALVRARRSHSSVLRASETHPSLTIFRPIVRKILRGERSVSFMIMEAYVGDKQQVYQTRMISVPALAGM